MAPTGAIAMSTVAPTSPQATEPQPPKRKLGSREAWLLGVCCVAQFMVILDLSIVNVALPSIQLSLNFTAPELQWIVDAYAITFAGFLMLGGRAADHFGQRRMFVLALLLFGLASLAGGIANDRTTLVAARAAQGLGGALMAACSLAVITSSFAPGPKLNRAIGAWAAMNGLGGAAGMLFGGLITQELSWRWVLLINPPIAIVAAAIAYAVVSERRRAPGARFDLAGALTLTIGQMVLVFGVVEAGLAGWDTTAALGPIIGGIALLGVFVRDRDVGRLRTADPLQGADQAIAGRQQHRAAVQRLAVPDVVRELALSATGAGSLAAAHRPDLPADDLDDHAGGLAGGQACGPIRGEGRARRRADHADRRDAAALADRLQRQPDRLHHDPGPADRGGHRDVDRALHDRRHPGRQGGPSRARLGPCQHLPPDRRRAWPGGAGDACDPALKPADRRRRACAPGADRRLQARLPDRCRPGRGGGTSHVYGDEPSADEAPWAGGPPLALAIAAGVWRASSRSILRSRAPTARRSGRTRPRAPTVL